LWLINIYFDKTWPFDFFVAVIYSSLLKNDLNFNKVLIMKFHVVHFMFSNHEEGNHVHHKKDKSNHWKSTVDHDNKGLLRVFASGQVITAISVLI
jgi:hypothetical protein